MDSAVQIPKIKQTDKELTDIRLQWNCPFEPACTDHFDSKAACHAHLNDVHDCLPYRCLVSDCTASFGTTNEIGAHIKSAHLPRFQCAKCPKSYSTYTKLRDHHYENHQTGLLQCLHPHCNQIFTNKTKLYRHRRVHSTVNCTECGKKVKRSSLWAHQQIHSSDERPYKCTTCKVSFTTKHTLEIHQRLHFDVKPYTCSVCSKACTQSSHMKIHEETHREATLSCDYCEKKFGGKHTLKQHFRVFHREQWTSMKEAQKKEQESYLLFANLRLLAEVASKAERLPVGKP